MDGINYDKLIEKALKGVVAEALKIAAEEGLPGEHHYYITFKTNHPKTHVSKQLRKEYPEEMTIVIQHQYSNLIVGQDGFSIDLSFSGIKQTLEISYDSISYFADPYAKFGLSFNVEREISNDASPEDAEGKKQAQGGATVVSIDSFRKRK